MTPALETITYQPLSTSERLKVVAQGTWRRFRDAWRIYATNKLALLGLVLLSFYTLLALLYPLLMGHVWQKNIYDPVTGFDMMVFPHPSPPSATHLLGTDTLGRDALSILMAASGPSLVMAWTAALSAAFVGTLVAVLCAYFRGPVDGALSNLAYLVLLAPAPIVMVVIGFVIDITPFQFGLIYGVLTGLGPVAIVLRSHALSIMQRTFIEASCTAGAGALHIMIHHLTPHLIPLAAINMLLTVTGAIFASGFIAFMGLSRAQLNWGSMIYDSFTYQAINATITWNILIPASLAISFFAASFYFIALGLQEVAEPRKKPVERTA
jgi:peptide/nickel transport system permease protein